MSPSCIACEMTSAMLSKLLWVSSLIASCFSCFTVMILKDFCVVTVSIEKSRLVPHNTIPTGKPSPLANAVIETTPVITVDVLRLVSTLLVDVLIRSSLLPAIHKLQFHQANMP